MPAARRWLPHLAALALLTLPFYRPLLFSDRVLLFRDLARDFLPNKFLWAQSVARGEGIPYWNHFIHGGIPYYAINTTAPLHPLNALFLLTNPAKAGVYFIWAHYLALYAGFYLLARAYRAGRWQAMLLGAAFPLSGLMLSVHSLTHYLGSAAAVPFWLLCLKKWAPGKVGILWSMGALVGWPIIAGDPQFTYIMALATFAYLAWAPGHSATQKAGAYFLVGISALLFSSIQLLPTLGFLLKSDRLSLSASEAMGFSLHPLRLVETIIPLALGNRFGTGSFYLGESLVNFLYKNPFIFSVYPGFLLLVLAGSKPWRDRSQTYLLSGTLLTLLLCFGTYLQPSPYELVAKALPGMSLFRFPERLVFWAFLLFWLAGLHAVVSLKRLDSEQNICQSRFWPLLSTLTVPSLLLFASLCALAVFRLGLFGLPAHWHAGALCTAGLALIWITLLLRRKQWKKSSLVFFGAFSLFAEGWITGQKIIWDQSIHALDVRRYPLAEKIKNDLKNLTGGSQAKRFSSIFSENQSYWAGSIDYATSTTNYSMHALLPNTGMFHGIEDASGYLSLEHSTRNLFLKEIVMRTPRSADPRFIHDIMAVRYVPELKADGSVALSINGSAQPYAFFPSRVHFAQDDSAAISLMKSSEFRSNKDLALAIPQSATPIQQGEELGLIEVTSKNGREISVRITADINHSRYLLLNESFDPNWIAHINNKPLKIELGNQWAMAVLLPESEEKTHSLKFLYRDPLIPAGQALSGIWLTTAIALFFRQRKFSLRPIVK